MFLLTVMNIATSIYTGRAALRPQTLLPMTNYNIQYTQCTRGPYLRVGTLATVGGNHTVYATCAAGWLLRLIDLIESTDKYKARRTGRNDIPLEMPSL